MGVPVGKTISRAYGFAARRALQLFGLGWLAAVFYAGAVSYLLTRLSSTMLVWPRPDAGTFNDFALFYLFCLVALTALANAVIGSALTREALKPDAEWKTAYFSLARREWSLFLNLILLYAIVIGIVTALLFAGEIAATVSTPLIGNDGMWRGVSVPPLITSTIDAISVMLGLFLATRFGFFLAPMAVDDPPTRILHAWTLSRGKFWRLLLASLTLVLPVLLVCGLVEWAVLGSQFSDAITAVAGHSRDNTALFQLIGDHAFAIAAVWAAAFLVLNALFAGASAYVYRIAEHQDAPAREYVSMAEPTFAMAAPAARAMPAHLEPAFAAAPEPLPVEPEPEPEILKADAETMKDAAPAEVSVPEEPIADVVEHPSEDVHVPVADAVSEDTKVAPSDVLEEQPHAAEPEILVSAEPGVEALPEHPKEDDGLHLAAASEPAHADVAPEEAAPATPLPSFVQTQPSPAHEPSEAA